MNPRQLLTLTIAAASTLLAEPAAAECLIRVPQDVPTLQQAIQQVCDGGVIELSPDVYPSPQEGFRISNLGKGFTIRSAQGGRAILDGGRSRFVLRMENSDRSRGKLVVFQRLTFRNGRSELDGRGGGITVQAGEARFVDCQFANNVAEPSGTGGGGALVRLGSSVDFIGGSFTGNHSPNRGGALEVLESEVTVQRTKFKNNRVNVAGHGPTALGGGIMVIDGVLHVADARFVGNEGAMVAGAIYGIGSWGQPLGVPSTEIHVTRSTFQGNRAEGHPCCPLAGRTHGGAIHVEDHTTLTVSDSRFKSNRAFFGGAVSSFRAIVEIAGSVFEDNRAEEPGQALGIGGAVASISSDPPGEAVNRRPAELAISRSILRGRANGAAVAGSGGCVFAAGDQNRLDGANGVPQQGGLGANRSRVRIEDAAFAGCGAENAGGALGADLLDLTLDDSLLLDSMADTGGGLFAAGQSAVLGSRTSFAGNHAEVRGGGFFALGSDLDLDAFRFLDNRVDGGTLGAAIFTMDTNDDSMTGTVAGSLFANDGIDIRDVEAPGDGTNEMRYVDNRFVAPPDDVKVYGHNQLAPNGTDVDGLNDLPQGDDNIRLLARPPEGDLVLVPPAGAAGSRTRSLVAFAWSGKEAHLEGPGLGAAGKPLLQSSGVIEITKRGLYSLVVDGKTVAKARLAKAPSP